MPTRQINETVSYVRPKLRTFRTAYIAVKEKEHEIEKTQQHLSNFEVSFFPHSQRHCNDISWKRTSRDYTTHEV